MVATLFLLAACSPQRALEAAWLLAELAPGAGTEQPAVPPPPVRRLVLGGRSAPADLYLADAAPEAALVLVPGLVPEGKDDPRLVAFAEGLARARFAVLVPNLPSFRAQRASVEDAGAIARAVDGLSRCFAAGTSPEVGLAAISYAVGPALIAARDLDTHRRIRLILAIGGYYSMTNAVAFLTTGYSRDAPDGPWRYREPNVYGKWAFVLANADRLHDPDDRDTLAALAARKLGNPHADVGALAAELGPEGHSIMALIGNQDPDGVPALIAALPDSVRHELEALDPAAQGLDGLGAELILIHGRDDAIIPASESRALAAALPPGQVAVYIVDSLMHVELGPRGLGDILRLWRAGYGLLAARDKLSRPDPSQCLDGPLPDRWASTSDQQDVR
jgi:hypothetical protein